MKGLKLIPLFLVLMILVFIGMKFVDANREDVIINFGNYQSLPTSQGFVVLTSVLVGMVVCGTLCSVEILALYVQNRKLRRKLAALAQATRASMATATKTEPSDIGLPKSHEGAH